MLDAEAVKKLLQLQPLPLEGGYFRETWRAADSLVPPSLPARYAGPRAVGSAIYYLLTSEPGCFSALHRLLSDEVYHFYLGDPVELLLLHPDSDGDIVTLGPDIAHGQQLQTVAPRGAWQGSRLLPGGRFALLGTTMAPAYDPADFTLGDRARLLAAYPRFAHLIPELTRA